MELIQSNHYAGKDDIKENNTGRLTQSKPATEDGGVPLPHTNGSEYK